MAAVMRLLDRLGYPMRDEKIINIIIFSNKAKRKKEMKKKKEC
jgi:hypothetical protein